MKRFLATLTALLLIAGCGLPLGDGVHEPGQVPAEERVGGDIQVLPPGPRDDASAIDIVRGFYGAQSSPDDAHASAREFLAPEIRAKWRDNVSVGVLDSGQLDVNPVPGLPNALRVTGRTVAEIAGDGSYQPGLNQIDVEVVVRRGPRGRWLITKVPDGLLLSASDQLRSFRSRNIYYLAPPAAPGAASSHLVPDQVFLPVTADNADGLVRRLLAGPSQLLGDSVSTAFPKGTALRGKVTTNTSGLVTVDLTATAARASAQQREQISAQLVWTLRGSDDFSKLRLLSAGRPLPSGSGRQAVDRERNDWQPYDPNGLPARPPLYYISGRRLRQLDAPAVPGSDRSQREVMDLAAASPRGGGLALIERGRGGAELRTGPFTGPFQVRARAASLSFLSWGSGEAGVWYLQNGRVMLAPLTGRPVNVPVDGLARYGPLAGVRVSRDGARVGLIAGVGRARRLLIGRIAEQSGALRIVGVHGIAPNVEDVQDLTWEGATSLVALGLAAGIVGPVRVAADGSSVGIIARVGFDPGTEPVAVAAAPNPDPGTPRLEVAAALGVSRLPVLYRASGANRYVREAGVVGAQPFYPG
ncbi:MAG: hypothetical protein QOE05_1112 [Actinomycetota bacterium]|nr:hypothetical protein [Actinomycetota bacterium]